MRSSRSTLVLFSFINGVFSQYSESVYTESRVASSPVTISEIKTVLEGKTGCPAACAYLASQLPERVFGKDSEEYKKYEANYWSLQQANVGSECRITPVTAEDVSVAILAFEATECKFAIKSGGVSTPPGASSIKDGVVVDFVNMRGLKIAEDQKTVSLETGAQWGNIFKVLDPLGITVVGGRVSQVGVGGFILGGGVSFISNKHGWACENVRNYEVVFADGTVNNVNKQTHPELFWALCGGGNNFGIVTRFDLAAYEQGPIYAGSVIYTTDVADQGIKAFSDFARLPEADPEASVIYGFSYAPDYQMDLASAFMTYNKPVVDAPILEPFTKIPNMMNTLRMASITEMCKELKAITPPGKHQVYRTFTTKDNPEALTAMKDIFFEEIKTLKGKPGFVPSFMFQPLTKDFLKRSESNGGNPFGMKVEDGPLTDCLLNFAWGDAADSDIMLEVSQRILERSQEAAKKADAHHPFLYMNYGAPEQKVVQSYGEENCAKLRMISEKYDPEQVFQKLQPGHHKLVCS